MPPQMVIRPCDGPAASALIAEWRTLEADTPRCDCGAPIDPSDGFCEVCDGDADAAWNEAQEARHEACERTGLMWTRGQR